MIDLSLFTTVVGSGGCLRASGADSSQKSIEFASPSELRIRMSLGHVTSAARARISGHLLRKSPQELGWAENFAFSVELLVGER